MSDTLELCKCEIPDPYVRGVGVTGCRRCSGYVKAAPKNEGEAEANCANISAADLNLALLEIDRMEREMKTMAGRLSAVKATLKAKLTSQVG